MKKWMLFLFIALVPCVVNARAPPLGGGFVDMEIECSSHGLPTLGYDIVTLEGNYEYTGQQADFRAKWVFTSWSVMDEEMGSWENTTEHPKSTHMYDPVRMVSTFALSNFARAYDSHPPNGELERAPVNGWYLVEVTIEKKVNGQWEWYDWDYWTVERD